VIARRRVLPIVPLLGLLAACVACHDAGVPVELDLASTAATLVDGVPQAVTVETAGDHRRVVTKPGEMVEYVVRVPRDPVVRFTLDPRVTADAFAITVGAGEAEHVARARSDGKGDWTADVDLGAPGDLVRLRFQNRGTAPLAWWGLQLTGRVEPRPPVLPADARPPTGLPINVVVLVSDALRADHLSLYGYRRPTTPELAKLASQHGIVFDHAYATGPSTPSSIPSLFTSRPPSALGLNFRAMAGGGTRTLAEALNLGGVRTAGFVGNPLLLPDFGYARGFGAFEIVRSDGDKPRYPRAETFVDRALEYLSVNRDAQSFVYLQVMDTHTPFDPPSPQRGRFAGEGPPRPTTPMRATDAPLPIPSSMVGPWAPDVHVDPEDFDPDHYDEAILYVDEQIGRLVRGLETLGIADRTALVVTADHGEALGAEDDGNHLHGHALYEELVHVPLVFLLPWVHGARHVTEVASHLDLAPTLVDLVGFPMPQGFIGTSHFQSRVAAEPPAAFLERLVQHWTTHKVLGSGEFGVAEWGIREGRWKLLLENGRVRLFDLSADPKETSDVSGRHPEITAYLAGRIARTSPGFTQRDRPPIVDPAAGGLERPLSDALKALGYIAE
jgi:arylsulfatase